MQTPVSLGRVAVVNRPGLALRLPQWIDLDTGNSYGSRIPTACPADVYHYTEPPGAYPYTFLFA